MSGGSRPHLAIVSDDLAPPPILHGRLLDFPDDPIACMRKVRQRTGEDVAALEEEGQRIYFAFGPQHNHEILSDPVRFHSRFFAIRGPRNSPQRRISSGLLSMNGEQHKRNRRLVMDAFMKKAIGGYVPSIKQITEQMLAEWRPGQERDLSRDMTEFMLRLTSTILFGLDNAAQAYQIGRMIDHWVHLNHELGMGAFVSDPALAARYEELLDFAAECEREILEVIRERRAASEPGQDALSLLLHAHDDEGAITDGELVGQASLLFAASHLTTAHSLTWTLFLLAQHPSVMRELSAELSVLGGRFPTPEQVERLPLMERVIKESLRILPASAYSQRVAAEPVTLGSLTVPRGAGIVFSQFMTHHMAELYAEPEAFRPDRWLGPSPSPYAYLPFGAGPRMCIGASLATLILKTVLPTILQRFKLTVLPMSEVSCKVISTMLSPTSSVLMRLDFPDGHFEAQPVVGNIHSMVELREVDRRMRAAA